MKIQIPEQRIKSFERKQYIVSILALTIFCGFAVILNTLHLQTVAEENTRFLSRMVKIGDFRETALILQEARLTSFTTIQYESEQPGRSFVLPPKTELFRQDSFWKSISKDSVTIPVSASLLSGTSDKITFEFERFRLVPYGFLIWLILNLVSIPQTQFMKRRLMEQFHRDLEVEKKVAKSEIAQQVRHNLRTPLASLMRIPKKLPNSVAKDRELLELTIDQIRGLISKLDDKPIEELSSHYSSDLFETLDQARRELNLYVSKSVEFKFEIDDMISSMLISHIPFELRSVLGNLVTNSLEAIGSNGTIAIKAVDEGSHVEIMVIDNGCGVSPENLDQIFEQGFTYGKQNGSGVGLSHARDQIESWGGTILAESAFGMGTKLTIKLPVNDRADWYLPRLKFNSDSKIFILDDQETARELWRLKFEDTKLLERTLFASKSDDVTNFQKDIQISPNECTLLFDYDIGKGDTGLEWLERMPQAATRCLVTGHFDSAEVRAACLKSGIYLIPKSQIVEIPLIIL